MNNVTEGVNFLQSFDPEAIPASKEQPPEPLIYSVTLISKALKDIVEGNFSSIRVKGEVQGLKRHTSGHIYFALKDVDAVMDAVCWRGTGNVNMLREGLEIVAFGKITTYPGRSKYQMIISSFEASGEGALLQQLYQLKEKLTREGLFDPCHKKRLPPFPRRIGMITSSTGAVIKDMLHRIEDRYPCHVLLKPVAVQGEGAAIQVCDALRLMHQLPNNLRPDVIIIARGGGSLEDLFAFNDEALVREVFRSTIPIISAIGHETDFTLLDFVSDVRAPTPTAAAEIVTPVLSQIIMRMEEMHLRMKRSMVRMRDVLMHRLARFDGIFKDPLRLIFEKQQRIDDWTERLHMSVHRGFAQRRLRLGGIFLQIPSLDSHKMKVEQLTHLLKRSHAYKMEGYHNRLDFLARQLESVSFKKTLTRGFCLAQNAKGEVIDTTTSVPTHPFTLYFQDGTTTVQATLKTQGKLF